MEVIQQNEKQYLTKAGDLVDRIQVRIRTRGIPNLIKWCSGCLQEKDLSEFHKNRAKKDGLATVCRSCAIEKSSDWVRRNPERAKRKALHWNRSNPERRLGITLKHLYGINLLEYHILLSNQGGGCAICGKLPEEQQGRMLSVDHDHITGKVRGILCDSCNLGIGRLGDDPALLQKAIDYLRRGATT